MHIEAFTVGMLSTNCYVASCEQTKEAIVIDPGLDFSNEAKPIFDYIERAQLTVKFIVNTHGHQDHINGDALFQNKYPVPICIHTQDADCIADLQTGTFPTNILLIHGDKVKFGVETLTVMNTPGHTLGSICLINEKIFFTGDTLFAQGVGRTDFPESSPPLMRQSLDKIGLLPDNLVIYPGHGETSTMKIEKEVNPFLGMGNMLG
jgi:hydroxyacylglutathione hydrolase